MTDFDENHKKILAAFISLKNKCTFLEKHALERLYILNRNEFPFLYANSFYSHMRDICDLSIVFVINEEISNAAQRPGFGDLLNGLLEEGYVDDVIVFNGCSNKMSPEDFNYALSDIGKLMVGRINQIVGSHMLDFSISAFSAFEKWISAIYSCFSDELDKFYLDSRTAKAKKLFEAYVKAEDESSKERIVKRALKLQGAYVSFPDKLNAILNKMAPNSYPRDLSLDKKIIEFLRVHRNTVHNGGVHHGAAISVTYHETEFSMTPGAPMFNDNWVRSIEFTGELLDIYTNILLSIVGLPPNAYCSFQENWVAIANLDDMTRRYRNSDLADKQCAQEMVDFLMRRLDLNNDTAINLISYLRDMINKLSPEQEVDLYELLSSDMTKLSPRL